MSRALPANEDGHKHGAAWLVPVGGPPTGTSQAAPCLWPSSLAGNARLIPSGESPDGTRPVAGQWPVLPLGLLQGRSRVSSPLTPALSPLRGEGAGGAILEYRSSFPAFGQF